MTSRTSWLCAPILLLLAGCGSDAEVASAKPATSVVKYGPAAASDLTPFPSNRYSVPDPSTPTGIRVKIGPEDTNDPLANTYPTTLDELNELDGFSTTGGVIIELSAPIDARGLVKMPNADAPVLDPVRDASEYTKPDSPIVLVNVDPASPERGKPVGIVPVYYEQPMDVDYDFDEYTVIAQPATPLRPGTTYALAVTDGLLAKDGTHVGRSHDMNAALEQPSDDYSKSLVSALGEIQSSLGISKKHVMGATVFTTESATRSLVAMSKANRALPAPKLVDAFSIETPFSNSPPRVRFRASYQTPEYRKPKPDGKWELDANGAPKTQATVALELFLAFSDATKSGPRPVVIYQHGLGGDKDGCWGTADRLSQIDPNGAAVIAIDSPEHGSRGGASGLVGSVYGFFGIDPNTNEFDIGRARDNFRQMASDQLELVRFVNSLATLDLLPLDANGQPAPDGKPDLDVSRIYYIGHSFGSVQGPTVFALAPEITTATWNVGGANLMMLLRDSALFSVVVKSLTPPRTPFGAVARFMTATQAIVDPGDALNYAPYATLEALPGVDGWKARDVLLQEVANDNTVPNSTTEALARAAGLGVMHRVTETSGLVTVTAPVTGNLASGSTGVVSQFDLIEGGKQATHGELIFSPEAQGQYVSFFASAAKAPHATVKAAY